MLKSKLEDKLKKYYNNTSPEQVVTELKELGIKFKNRIDPKFRAFDRLTNKFIATGFHVIGEVTIFGIIDQWISENLNGKSHLDRYNDIDISQYVEIQDQNGKDIYVGDLLSYSIGGYPQSVSFYVDTMYSLHIELNRDDPYYRIDRHSLKVIGNVFENESFT